MSMLATCSLVLDGSDECESCRVNLLHTEIHYAFAQIRIYKNDTTVYLHRACKCCANADEAIIDALTDGRRFTVVGVGDVCGTWSETYQDYCRTVGGPRCPCGSASHRNKKYVHDKYPRGRDWNGDYCVMCNRNTRMISVAERKLKLMKSALYQMKKQIKSQLLGVSA